jgi:hypothetical protein
MNGHAICPFCDRPVMYGGVEFGVSFLHDECFATVQQEMEVDGDEDTVVIESKPLLENDENGERGE